MKCPKCSQKDTFVTNSRPTKSSTQVWRRRRCPNCQFVFSSYEKPELGHIKIVRSSGSASPYRRFLLSASLWQAFEHRLQPGVDIDAMVDTLEQKLQDLQLEEIETKALAAIAAQALRPIELSAYLRYIASHSHACSNQELKQLLNNK